MIVNVQILKDIPKEQINKFKDRTVYNAVVATRELTKNNNSYPKRTGKLRDAEIMAPIIGAKCEYSLLAGVNYATKVWTYKNVHWTNPNTVPQWYYNVFKSHNSIILNEATTKALKEIK